MGKVTVCSGPGHGQALEGREFWGAAGSMALKADAGPREVGDRSPCSLLVCGSDRLSKDELRCQYRGQREEEEGRTRRREKSPSHLALGAGEGTCSPLRVGEWLLPHSMAMYKENGGQIVHQVSVNPQKPWGHSGYVGEMERMPPLQLLG